MLCHAEWFCNQSSSHSRFCSAYLPVIIDDCYNYRKIVIFNPNLTQNLAIEQKYPKSYTLVVSIQTSHHIVTWYDSCKCCLLQAALDLCLPKLIKDPPQRMYVPDQEALKLSILCMRTGFTQALNSCLFGSIP